MFLNFLQVVEIKLRFEIYEKRRKTLTLQRGTNKGILIFYYFYFGFFFMESMTFTGSKI